jgi:hypothetical protein
MGIARVQEWYVVVGRDRRRRRECKDAKEEMPGG